MSHDLKQLEIYFKDGSFTKDKWIKVRDQYGLDKILNALNYGSYCSMFVNFIKRLENVLY